MLLFLKDLLQRQYWLHRQDVHEIFSQYKQKKSGLTTGTEEVGRSSGRQDDPKGLNVVGPAL